MIEAGAQVIIKGLVSRPELTGVHGIVERKAAKAGRWNVKLKGLSNIHKFGASISLKTANIEVVPTMPFFTPISGMGSAHPEPANTVIDRSVVRVMRGLKAIKPSLFTPFIMQQADLDQALANSPFNTLSEDLILSILIRASRATHRALSSTCKRFHFLVRGKKFIEARRHCPTTGFSCLEQLLVLVGGGGGSVAHSDIMGNGISVFSPGGPWCQASPLKNEWRFESVVEFEEELYIIGGTHHGRMFGGGFACEHGCVAVWSPLRNDWRFTGPINTPRIMARAVACGERVYLFGGVDALEMGSPVVTCEVYNPKTETWALLPRNMPKPVHEMSMHANGPKIFVFGGAEMTKGNAESVDFIQVFDTRTKMWSRLPPMPMQCTAFASVQVDDTIYFLGGHQNLYKGKDLVAADIAKEDCCICMEKLGGPIYDPPGRECDGCNTSREVKMKCPCGLVRYCNQACQRLHRPAHKKACKAALQAAKEGNSPVAKLVCGHAIHLKCFHEHCDHKKQGNVAFLPDASEVPCPLCRHNIDQSAFYDKRTTDTESKWTTKTVKSTWSYNMSSGTWTALADAPFEHDFFFVLEQPGRERIVSVDEANLASHDMLGSIAYNIASNVWEHNTSVPPKPHKHDQSQSLASMMVP